MREGEKLEVGSWKLEGPLQFPESAVRLARLGSEPPSSSQLPASSFFAGPLLAPSLPVNSPNHPFPTGAFLSKKRARVSSKKLHSVLRERFALEEFRAGQREAVEAVLDGRDALVIMPTGSGKSLIYQLPALLLPGLTVVVSPLIALMKDQTDKLEELGVDAHAINSSLTDREKAAKEEAVEQGGGKILYVTPERFRDRDFFEVLLGRKVSLFVVDEAHCISEWGHDFRPDYRRLGQVVAELKPPRLAAFTATATPEVRTDIAVQLGMDDARLHVRGFDRPNLSFDIVPFEGKGSKARKLALLEHGLKQPEHRPA